MSDQSNPSPTPSPTPAPTEPPKVEHRCCDCGLETTDKLPIGWVWLAVGGKWRCKACADALDRANGYAREE